MAPAIEKQTPAEEEAKEDGRTILGSTVVAASSHAPARTYTRAVPSICSGLQLLFPGFLNLAPAPSHLTCDGLAIAKD